MTAQGAVCLCWPQGVGADDQKTLHLAELRAHLAEKQAPDELPKGDRSSRGDRSSTGVRSSRGDRSSTGDRSSRDLDGSLRVGKIHPSYGAAFQNIVSSSSGDGGGGGGSRSSGDGGRKPRITPVLKGRAHVLHARCDLP